MIYFHNLKLWITVKGQNEIIFFLKLILKKCQFKLISQLIIINIKPKKKNDHHAGNVFFCHKVAV